VSNKSRGDQIVYLNIHIPSGNGLDADQKKVLKAILNKMK
jgi:hypothetical protein